jgi:hypothetical protein
MSGINMQVLCPKHNFTFFNRGPWNAKSKGYEGGGGDKFVLSPKPSLQSIPDWVRHDNTFKAAAKVGAIVEIQRVVPVIEEAEPIRTPATGLGANGPTGARRGRPPGSANKPAANVDAEATEEVPVDAIA